jgi:hypothetical protein
LARADSKKERMIVMIVKYESNGIWAFIDNVRQIAAADLDASGLIEKYDEEQPENDSGDHCCYLNGKRLNDDVVASNKAFQMACDAMRDQFDSVSYGNCHMENLLDGNKVLENFPAAAILIYLNDHKEYDTLVLVTNQKCFLMNDKGQTIERLV